MSEEIGPRLCAYARVFLKPVSPTSWGDGRRVPDGAMSQPVARIATREMSTEAKAPVRTTMSGHAAISLQLPDWVLGPTRRRLPRVTA